MEKSFEQLAHLLTRKLDLYRNLEQLLEDEKHHIISMDLEQLWDAVNQKNQVTARIQAVRKKMTERAAHGTGSLKDIIAAAPLSLERKSELKEIVCRIDTCKKEITVRAAQNKRYLSQYLTVIDDVFATIFSCAKDKQYSYSGQVSPAEARPNLIRTEV
jgi:flagellar biosynthesis/type III secretory pathway chaperone